MAFSVASTTILLSDFAIFTPCEMHANFTPCFFCCYG